MYLPLEVQDSGQVLECVFFLFFFFPWEKLQDVSWLVEVLQGRNMLTIWGLYRIQWCFQMYNLWKVYTVCSAVELEEGKVRKSKSRGLQPPGCGLVLVQSMAC